MGFSPPTFFTLGGEGRAGLYLVTAGGHPSERFARAFDLLFQGTKRGLLSEEDIRWPCWLLLYLDRATEDMPGASWDFLGNQAHIPQQLGRARGLSWTGSLSALGDSLRGLVSLLVNPSEFCSGWQPFLSTLYLPTPKSLSGDPQPYSHPHKTGVCHVSVPVSHSSFYFPLQDKPSQLKIRCYCLFFFFFGRGVDLS